MIPAQFDYLAPTTIDEALAALAEHGDDAKILAGGQSLLPVLRMRLNAPEVVIDLGKIPELRGVRDDGDHLVAETEQRIDQRGTDEPGPTCHHDSHRHRSEFSSPNPTKPSDFRA